MAPTRYSPIMKWVVYLLYASLLTVVLLVVRFPAEKLKAYTTGLIEQRFPSVTCTLGQLSYDFPLSLRASEIRLTDTISSVVLLNMKRLVVKPEMEALGNRFSLSAEGYEGQHQCRFTMDWNKDELTLHDLKMNQFNLAGLSWLHDRLGRSFSGHLDVTAFHLDNDGMVSGKGHATITNGDFDLLQPVLFLKNIDLQKAEMDFKLKDGNLVLTKGSFNGKQLKGNFTGTVQLDSPWFKTKLLLTGKFLPKAPVFKNNKRVSNIVNRLKKKYKSSAIPFVVKGDVKRPTFRFGH